MTMLRLFAALDIPEDIAEALLARAEGIPGAQWRPPEALHLTLRFFGELDPHQADDLDLELAAIRQSPLEIRLQGVGQFGAGDHMHALWAGVAENDALRTLAQRCDKAARMVGLAPDTRLYTPHVTLAYLKRPDPIKVAEWLSRHALLSEPVWRAASFGLYSSQRGHDGPAYDLEREYWLK